MEDKQAPRIRQLGMRQRIGAAICSGALAVSGIVAPMAAFAEEIQPSVSGNGDVATAQTGSGATDVTIQLKHGAQEMTGTDDPDNPDADEPRDGLGDNIAFTVPTSINFVSNAAGVLTGPSEEATYIENESVFSIYASSANVVAQNNWQLVPDAQADTSGTHNLIDFQWGPKDGTLLDASDYEQAAKKAIANKAEWQMSYAKNDGASKNDRVELSTQGNIANVDQEIKDRTKVAIIHTYVTPGEAS